MKTNYSAAKRPAAKLFRAFQILFIIFVQLISVMQVPHQVLAASGAYSLKWYAADPAVNRAPYLPTYVKVPPSQVACPTPSGGVGRAADPMKDAVAYGSSFTSNQLDAVTSLAPKDLALGQIVPFEMEISVSGSTAPENGVIQFTSGFNTHTTSGDNFGYDPNYMVYCAFVDTADKGTIDPGNNAKVDSWTATLANPGGGSSEEIQGAFQISGLESGDNVIVEIWVVLKPTIPAGSSGNVQTRLVDAHTVTTPPATISTGNQTVPLLRVREFFTSAADVSITKSDSPDPVVLGSQLTYTIVATNNSTDTIANGVVVTDTLDPNTTFVSGTWSGGACTAASGIVTCNVGALAQGSSVTITVVVAVKTTAPTNNDTSSNPEAGGAGTACPAGVDLCNKVSETAITSDPTAGNNSYYQPTNVTGAPALTLTKTASPTTYSAVGQTISYSYELKNTGNVTLSSPFAVTDDKASVTCPSTPTSLAPNDTLTCTASYTITQADLDAGSVTNKATATAAFNGSTVTSNQATTTVTAVKSPALSLTKSATPATYDAVGQTIHYSYIVENTGNVALSGPFTVSDDKAADEACPTTSSLAPGASITCTASYVVTQADLDAGSVTNIASATNGTITSPTDTVTVPATQNPALSLKKSADPLTYAAVGQIITYDYLLTSSGNVTLSGPFTVSDDKAQVTCPAEITSLAPGATLNCTATYTVSQSDLDSGKVTNIATATAKFGDTTVTSNQDTVTVTAAQSPALALVKSASPSTYDAVGQIISYSYKLTNSGNITLAGPFTVSDDKATVTCPADATLAIGVSITCEATYTITQADLDAGSVTNIATGHATTMGGAPVNSNNDSATVNTEQKPALTLDKTAQETTYAKVGDVLHYSYLVTNSGNVTLHDAIAVLDNKTTATCPALPEGGLAPGASITCEATYTIKQADLDAGSVTNIASASSGTTVSPTDTVTVPATQSPALTIVKTATPSTYSKVGDVINYSYLVTNTGNVMLSNISVTDDRAAVTCPDTSGGLAPQGQITCSAAYPITQADLDAGSVTNSAYATSGTTQSLPDTETVTANRLPALSLTKNAVAHFSTPVKVGDTIDYTLTATNTGNIALTNVSISDARLGTLTCTPDQPATLIPLSTLTCTGTYAITQADINAGKVDNTVIAKSDQTPPTETPNEVPVPKSPALTIDKTASPATYDKVGDVITYSYKVTNSGNVTLPDAITVIDDKVTVTCPALPVGGLAPGDAITCTASYTITQADLDAGSVTNSAYAKSGDTQSPPDVVTVPGAQTPALTIDKTAAESTYGAVGDVIHYSYLVTNSGNVTLHDAITVTDNKISVTCPALPEGGLASGGSITCTASYTIQQTDLDVGAVTNSAYAKSGDTQSPPDEVTVPATQTPALTLVKTAVPHFSDPARVGDTIDYTLTAKNTGNITLNSVTISDAKLGSLTCTPEQPAVLAPSATLVCTGSYVLTQADLDAGKVDNTAFASSKLPGGGDGPSGQDSKDVPVPQSSALTLDKTASPATYSKIGDVITYSYKVTNSGKVTLAGPFTITDNKATVTCPATSSLAPDAFITCTASYVVTQADLDAGSITNTATATNGTVTSNEASATVNAVQNPAITLTKTASPSFYSNIGDVISYTLVAKNTGNVPLYEVSISDPKLGALTCTPIQPATLAPTATLTCTGSYTIQASDLLAGQLNQVTNTATVNGKGPKDQPVSNTATATVYQQTGVLLPTQTTCQMYAAGPSAWPAMYANFNYQVKSGKINSVSPGVIFYYNTITAPSASFTLTVVEKNTLGWKPMLVQDLGQVILYNADCSKASGVTVSAKTDSKTNTYTVTFKVTGATAGAIYYIGIKYSPQNLVGQAVKAVGGVYPTDTYSFSTSGQTSSASIPVKPK